MRKAELLYKRHNKKPIIIGSLLYDGHKYTFTYHRSFFNNPEGSRLIRVLPFPKNDVATSSRLFPFFKRRLPDKKRQDYHRILLRNRIENGDELSLLLARKGKLPTDNFEIREVK